ncbi:MAG: hypothetical protein ACI9XR_001762 [Flavobacterium sp.]|jgi:hypothetical protein
MKTLNIKLIFPYNWYHFRFVKVYSDKGILLTKISHCDNQQIYLDADVEFLVLKLDFFRSEFKIPKNDNEIYVNIFLNFQDTFPKKYFDVLKRQCLTGKVVDKIEFDKFDLGFYNTKKIWLLKSNIDKPNLILGLLISIGLIILSIVEQKNEFQDLIFFISVVSFISLLMIVLEKEKLLLYDYNSRMSATGFAFILATFFLNSSQSLVIILLIFSFLFLIRNVRIIK